MPAATPASLLVCRFVADVLACTIDSRDDDAHRRTVQAFVEELRPWMAPVPLRSQPPLFAMLKLTEPTGLVSVTFTPEGIACFRGWLRRQGLDAAGGTS